MRTINLAKPAVVFITCAVISTVISVVIPVVVRGESTANLADRILNEDEMPVQFLSILERDYGSQGDTWALPEKVGTIQSSDRTLLATAGANPDEFQQWVRERGGVDVGLSVVKLVVTNWAFAL
jgi:hypothetical protein